MGPFLGVLEAGWNLGINIPVVPRGPCAEPGRDGISLKGMQGKGLTLIVFCFQFLEAFFISK